MQGPGVPELSQGSLCTPRVLLRRAAKRQRPVCDPSSDENSDWAPGEAAPHAGVRARRGPPAQRAHSVPDAVLRNRVTQRQYLQRKKVVLYPEKQGLACLRAPQSVCRASARLQGAPECS